MTPLSSKFPQIIQLYNIRTPRCTRAPPARSLEVFTTVYSGVHSRNLASGTYHNTAPQCTVCCVTECPIAAENAIVNQPRACTAAR